MVDPEETDPRRVLEVADEASGLEAWIAVDERVDELAAGGIAQVAVHSADAGLAEAKRRARTWTLAARAAEIEAGGAQVLVRDTELGAAAAFEALGGPLDQLEPTLAVGFGEDLEEAQAASEHVNPEGTVPARAQAVGTLSGIQAVLWALEGDPRAEGSAIVLEDWTPVTRLVAQGLSEEGALVRVAAAEGDHGDVADAGHEAIEAEAWRDAEADVLVPSSPGLVTSEAADRLAARGVCSAQVGTLASAKAREGLAERQVQTAPEALVAASAVIEAVLVWREGQAPRVQDAIDRRLSEVYERTRRVLAEAADEGTTPAQVVRDRWG
jgi:hypothetical protein